MFGIVTKIGIDLGTANSLVYIPKKEIALNEPSVVAVSVGDNKILAVGREAKDMIGRTPDSINVYRPLKDGVIADFRVTQAMIKHFIEKVVGNFKFFKPELLIGVPAGISSVERRAVLEAGILAGAKQVYLAKEPVLAAIGAGIPINSCAGHMIVNMGGGTTEVAVISLGGVVTVGSLRVAGDKLNQAIADYIRKKYNLDIGIETAEKVKIEVATALPEKEEKSVEIRGRDLILGLPRNIKIYSNEVCEAISERLEEIIQNIKNVLRDTPPELSADIMDKGMTLSGGGALLRNFDKLIEREIGVPCKVAKDPLTCVARGTGIILENLEVYKKSIMTKR